MRELWIFLGLFLVACMVCGGLLWCVESAIRTEFSPPAQYINHNNYAEHKDEKK